VRWKSDGDDMARDLPSSASIEVTERFFERFALRFFMDFHDIIGVSLLLFVIAIVF